MRSRHASRPPSGGGGSTEHLFKGDTPCCGRCRKWPTLRITLRRTRRMHAVSPRRKLKASPNLALVVNFVDGCCRPSRHGNQPVARRWIDTSTWGRPLRGRCRRRLPGSPVCQLTQPTSSWPQKVAKSIAPRRRPQCPKQENVTTSCCGHTLEWRRRGEGGA